MFFNFTMQGMTSHQEHQTWLLNKGFVDAKSSPTKVTPFFPGYKPVMPPAFERSVALDVKFMEAKARVFRSMPLLETRSTWRGLTKFSVSVKTNGGALGFSPIVLTLACCWRPFTFGKFRPTPSSFHVGCWRLLSSTWRQLPAFHLWGRLLTQHFRHWIPSHLVGPASWIILKTITTKILSKYLMKNT